MYRCVTELKGLIIDIDSFKDIDIAKWNAIGNAYKCVFMTSNQNTMIELEKQYSNDSVVYVEDFVKLFAPNNSTHVEVLSRLGCCTTEVSYISADKRFIDNALGFLCGVVWITKEVSYCQASKAADLICNSIDVLNNILLKKVTGFLGEVVVYPNAEKIGLILPVKFEVDGEPIILYMLGRYFGYSHYMNQMHPYSTAIYLNKKPGKAYGLYNNTFYSLYKTTISEIMKTHEVDAICSVPAKPNQDNRFKSITDRISAELNLSNLTENFKCVSDYTSQKTLSLFERATNVKDAFILDRNIDGAKVVLIDDIVSTGATLKECIRVLRDGGAAKIICIALGINQLGGSYWTSDIVEIGCPLCGTKMKLLLNSNNKTFFYGCPNKHCNHTMDYELGRQLLVNMVNIK